MAGISSLPGSRELGSIGFKALGYYATTTAIAVGIGVAAVLIIQPGNKAASEVVRQNRVEVIDGYKQDFAQLNNVAVDEIAADADLQSQFAVYMAQQDGELAAGASAAKWQSLTSATEKTTGDMFLEDILRPVLTNPFNALSQRTPNALGVIFFAMLVGIACIIIGDRAVPVEKFFTAFNEIMMTITLWLMNLARSPSHV